MALARNRCTSGSSFRPGAITALTFIAEVLSSSSFMRNEQPRRARDKTLPYKESNLTKRAFRTGWRAAVKTTVSLETHTMHFLSIGQNLSQMGFPETGSIVA